VLSAKKKRSRSSSRKRSRSRVRQKKPVNLNPNSKAFLPSSCRPPEKKPVIEREMEEKYEKMSPEPEKFKDSFNDYDEFCKENDPEDILPDPEKVIDNSFEPREYARTLKKLDQNANSRGSDFHELYLLGFNEKPDASSTFSPKAFAKKSYFLSPRLKNSKTNNRTDAVRSLFESSGEDLSRGYRKYSLEELSTEPKQERKSKRAVAKSDEMFEMKIKNPSVNAKMESFGSEKQKNDPESYYVMEPDGRPVSSIYSETLQHDKETRKTRLGLDADSEDTEHKNSTKHQESSCWSTNLCENNLIYVLTFLCAINFSIVLPTMYDTMHNSAKVSEISSIYLFALGGWSVLEFCSSLVFGCFDCQKNLISILYISTSSLLLGNLVYTFGTNKPNMSLMVFGRILCGVGGAVMNVSYAHFTKQKRGTATFLRFCTIFGFIIGPALGLLLSQATINIGKKVISRAAIGPFIIIICLLCILSFLITRSCFHVVAAANIQSPENDSRYLNNGILGFSNSVAVSTDQTGYITDQSLPLIIIYVLLQITFWSFEAAFLPLSDVDTLYSNGLELYIFSFMTVMVIISYWIYRTALEQVSCDLCIFACMLTMAIGCFTLTKFDEAMHDWQLFSSCAFLVLGFTIGTLHITSTLMQTSEIESESTGRNSAIIFSVTSLGRVGGNYFGIIILQSFQTINFLSHLSGFILLFSAIGFHFLLQSQRTKEERFNRSRRPTPTMSSPYYRILL